MGKYRKKPVVIEAFNTTWVIAYWPEWAQHLGDGALAKGFLEIETLEGTMRADWGDWIIKGVKGELYPCKPDIFEETYESVD